MINNKNKSTPIKDEYIQFKIDSETKKRFRKYCDTNNKNASGIFRDFILDLLKNDSNSIDR